MVLGMILMGVVFCLKNECCVLFMWCWSGSWDIWIF